MADLKVCRICLKTEVKMYGFDNFNLQTYYEEVMAKKVDVTKPLPKMFCYECAMLLYKFHKFKEKCLFGQKLLCKMRENSLLTYEDVNNIDRHGVYLKPLLCKANLQEKISSKNYKDFTVQSIHYHDTDQNEIPTIAVPIDEDDLPLQPVTKTEIDDSSHDEWGNDTYVDEEIFADTKAINVSPLNMLLNETSNDLNIEDFQGWVSNRKLCKEKRILNKPSPLYDQTKWKRYQLTDEEALKEYNKRAEEKYYKTAKFKCEDCFKGFSTENMFKRHNKTTHDVSIGKFVCKFCKTRFKLPCNLRKHMRKHFIRFECLQCHVVMMDYSAILHNDYHSGIVKKCEHCGEEFRHQSTYYTHLRTHRSLYVCTLCGSSFVSQIGLQYHKKRKHVINDIESPDDDEQVNTYCRRCDITFESRKAYEEHLFHSVLHAEGIEDDEINLVAKKILGKRVKKEKCDVIKLSRKGTALGMIKEMKARRGSRRARKKPTTCHQCGKSFDTQAACMKHHTKEHPGSSFFAPGERHVCEICGASLAPGSVAMHENIHSRKKIYPCEVCGKEFHSSISLKRHTVTHTGEKPYGCTMCDKRFTQSNSMKLHYRTFHLKEPYPKRNRRKKKDDLEPKDIRDETNKTAEPNANAGDIRRDLSNVMLNRMQDENIHYLTLN